MKLTDTDKISNQVASILLEIGAVVIRPKQPFKFDSGIISPIYTDNRLIISYPNYRKKITGYFVDKIKKIGIPDVIAGIATAGIPHTAFIAQSLNLSMVYVRSKTKDHGKGNQVEGAFKKGQTVILIEDLVSTAFSSIASAKALRSSGAVIKNEICIFTYGLKEAAYNLKKAKINLHSLTNLETLCKVALKKGYLESAQIDTIYKWSKNPKSWGQNLKLTSL